MRTFRCCTIMILTVLLAGCYKSGSKAAPVPQLKQIKVTALPATLPAEAESAKANPSGPVLRFREDVTIPDGTKVRPGATFVKAWRLANDNEVSVPGHALHLSMADSYGPIEAPAAIWIPTVPPGKDVEVKAEMAIKADAPEGQCRAQYMGAPDSGMFLGPFCLVEIDKNAPPPVQ